MDDYYELLDVAPDAPRDDIRGAYRAKRDALQAEEGGDNRAKIAALNRAWNVLSDPTQRERYDDRLAEQRESGDDVEYDDDDSDDSDDERPPARTPAERRAEARRARMERRPTIAVPKGFTMAPVRARLMALGFDLLVLLFVLITVYLIGIKIIDSKFPGERHQRSELITKENKAIEKVAADQKRVAAAEKAKTSTVAARAAEAKDTKTRDQLDAEVRKIDRKINPWFYPVAGVAFVLLLLYLVPSTATSGQTLGKRIQKIRVVKLDGSLPGWKTASVRFGVPLLIGTFLGIKFLGPLGLVVAVLGMIGWVTNPNRQGLHDRLAKTIVVEA